jgi:hypothetical protein
MNKHLIPKTEFTSLVEDAIASDAAKEKLWFTIADRILREWNGVSYAFLNALTPGQSALMCCARFHRGAAYDFMTSLIQSELPELTFKAFGTLAAAEYLDLLQKLKAVFPGKKFPEYPEDFMAAYGKLPDDYFDKIADKFVAGTGMKRPLRDYIFEYVTAHPEDFSTAS